VGLDRHGLSVVGRVPLQIIPNDRNVHYLTTKKTKLGHLLDQV
jgi:3,4-dihydroxy 2-butanone 4-phosphate synthase/GTP cyclohydrolase II